MLCLGHLGYHKWQVVSAGRRQGSWLLVSSAQLQEGAIATHPIISYSRRVFLWALVLILTGSVLWPLFDKGYVGGFKASIRSLDPGSMLSAHGVDGRCSGTCNCPFMMQASFKGPRFGLWAFVGAPKKADSTDPRTMGSLPESSLRGPKDHRSIRISHSGSKA